MMALAIQYGYAGVFFVSLIGAVSIFFTVPDTAIVFALGGSLLFEPVWIAIAAAVGATLGEFTGYLLGFGSRKAMTRHFGKGIALFEKLLKRYGSLAIFAFAATPLPDDLIFIPLGTMRYSIVKAFVPAFMGKLLMYLTVVYGGRFFVDAIGDFFGISNDWISALASTILGIAVFVLMLKVDWEKHLGRFLKPKNSSRNETDLEKS